MSSTVWAKYSILIWEVKVQWTGNSSDINSQDTAGKYKIWSCILARNFVKHLQVQTAQVKCGQ